MEKSILNVLDETRNLKTATSEKMIEMMQQQAENAATINEARQALQDAIANFKEAVNQSARSLELIGSGANGMQNGLDAIETSIQKANRIQESTVSASNIAENNLRGLTQVFDNQKDVLAQYERTFSVLDKNVASILEKVGEQLGSYSRLVKDGLETHLEQFDEALGNATGKLTNTVRSLSDSLDTLMEIVESALSSLTKVSENLGQKSRNTERVSS
jgi:chromosome segregation ATPase